MPRRTHNANPSEESRISAVPALPGESGGLAMRRAFLRFLADEGVIPSDCHDQISDKLSSAPDPIGKIAFSYGIISAGDIDIILDEQRAEPAPFGEIAMRLGMLTPAHIESLLRVQQLRAATEAAEALVLAGQCSFETIMRALGQFLAETPPLNCAPAGAER